MISPKIIILAAIWAVAIWRLPAAIRVPKQRVLWLCFAALAVAITLGIPSVGHALDTAVGIRNLSILSSRTSAKSSRRNSTGAAWMDTGTGSSPRASQRAMSEKTFSCIKPAMPVASS